MTGVPVTDPSVKAQVETVAAYLDSVAEVWEDQATDFYYEHRHGGRGIGYAQGYEEGWDHAASLLRGMAEHMRRAV